MDSFFGYEAGLGLGQGESEIGNGGQASGSSRQETGMVQFPDFGQTETDGNGMFTLSPGEAEQGGQAETEWDEGMKELLESLEGNGVAGIEGEEWNDVPSGGWQDVQGAGQMGSFGGFGGTADFTGWAWGMEEQAVV